MPPHSDHFSGGGGWYGWEIEPAKDKPFGALATALFWSLIQILAFIAFVMIYRVSNLDHALYFHPFLRP